MHTALVVDFDCDIPWLIRKELIENPSRQSLDLNLPYGRLNINYWYLDGILIYCCDHAFVDSFWFTRMNTPDVVRLEFLLNGTFCYSEGNSFIQNQIPQHTLLYLPNIPNVYKNMEKESKVFMVEIEVPTFLRIAEDSNQALKEFAEKVINGQPAFIAPECLPINGRMYQVIQDIMRCPYSDGLRKVFLLSKTMELLVLQAELYNNALGAKTARRVNGSDLKRLNYVKEYMTEHLATPPNLTGLSKIAGMSEYKLKNGFKKLFNTTVFGYLSECRLKLAEEALHTSEKSISEIAYDLGYSSPQHFSAAFKKRYGYPPRSIKKA